MKQEFNSIYVTVYRLNYAFILKGQAFYTYISHACCFARLA